MDSKIFAKIFAMTICIGFNAGCNSDLSSLQERVLLIADAKFPELHCQAGSDVESVKCSEVVISLGNLLRADSLAREGGRGDEEIVNFLKNVSLRLRVKTPSELSWSEAAPLLRPQLASADYLTSSPIKLAHKPFRGLTDIIVVFAIDSEESFALLDEATRIKWSIDTDELLRKSIDNIDLDIANVKFTSDSSQGHSFLVVEANDGYAAARILSPKFCKILASKLGEKFHFALPNRNFLIAWRDSEVVPTQVISELFGRHTHPLTQTVLHAVNGTI